MFARGGVLKSKLKVLWAVILVTLLIGSLGISYAYFNAVDSNKRTANVILKGKTGCIDVSLTENEVELQYNYPITDEYAIDNVKPITITIKNNCSTDDVDYSLVITTLSNYEDEDENNPNIPASKIKTKIDKNNETLIETNFLNEINKLKDNTTTKTLIDNKLNNMNETKGYSHKNTYVIDKEKITKNDTITYEIYMWIDYNEGGINNSTKGKTFKNIISVVVNNPEDSVKAGVELNAMEYVLAQKPNGLSEKLLGDMYRFVGTKADVNNYICFGTTNKDECTETSDYMYRIIGITQDGKMKLIKNTAIREETLYQYYWHSDLRAGATWEDSDIFKRLNGNDVNQSGSSNLFIDSKTSNVQYITTGNNWYNKIEDHTWKYGDVPSIDTDADSVYSIESKFADVIQAKVGLIYVSDYYYSYSISGKDSSDTNCNYADHSVRCINSWMHISNNGKTDDYQVEWTMDRFGKNYNFNYVTYFISDNGSASANENVLYSNDSVRPVFYLNSDITLSGGIGSLSDPFIVEK